MNATTTVAPVTAGIRPDPTIGFRRRASALALPLGIVLQLAANVVYAIVSTESGLSDTETGAETLELYGRYPGAVTAATVLAMTGVLVLIPGLLAAVRVVRPHRPRLGLWAVVLMLAGYVAYFGIVTTNFGTLALADAAAARPEAGLAAVADASQPPAALPFFLLFVVGNLMGMLLLGLAVLLSRGLPRWAGVLILGWPVGHSLDVFAGLGEWFAVGGGVLEIAGLVVIALVALRTPNDEWARRG